MKKVTRLLLVAGVVAIGFGACKEGPTIVQPPPPPAPPPPDPQVAVITIQGLRTVPGNNPVDPGDVSGGINVLVNVDPGDFEITGISLLVDAQVLSCQAFAGASIGGVQASVSSSGQDVVECFLNTAAVVGECEGAQLDPRFTNGTHTIGARVTLSDGSTRDASNAQTVNFNNQNRLVVTRTTGGDGVVGQGVRYFGGTGISFAACPVDYDGRTIGTVRLAGTSAGGTANAGGSGPSVDLGGGHGALASATAANGFVFTATVANNLNEVEDLPTAAGHTIGGTGQAQVLTDQGENVTSQYVLGSLNLHLDFTAPVINTPAASAVLVQNAALQTAPSGTDGTDGEWFSSGVFILTNVSELGVGPATGVKTFRAIEGLGATKDTTPDVAGIADLVESNRDLSADIATLTDALGNSRSVSAVPQTGFFGVDMGAPTFSNVFPGSNIVFNGAAGGVGGDTLRLVLWSTSDPALGDGSAGSGVVNASVSAKVKRSSGTPDSVTVTTADASMDLVTGRFRVDVSSAGTALGDGTYQVTLRSPDAAILANAGTSLVDFILDTTVPTLQITQFPQGGSTAATSAQMSIGGNVTDANGLSKATITVRVDGTDANGTTGDDICQATDFKLTVGSGAGQIDKNDVDITSSAAPFAQTFTVQRPAAPVNPVKYCFFVNAEDNAQNNRGAADPNTAGIQTNTDINWQ